MQRTRGTAICALERAHQVLVAPLREIYLPPIRHLISFPHDVLHTQIDEAF